jgi:hypothetical protein
MPYQHCPACRLTVHLDDEVVPGGPCPRCGAALADEPRRLFADAVPRAVDANAVRLMMHRTGGRFSRRVPDR